MSKGLTLEEFRAKLETDATKRSDAQEKTILEQAERIRVLEKLLKEDEDQMVIMNQDLLVLTNRCFVMGKGTLCLFCELNSCKCKNKLW